MGAATVTDALRDELRAKLTSTPERVEKFVRADDVVFKAMNPDAHTVDVVISTPSIDRDHEVIETRAFRSAKGKRFPLVDSHKFGEGVRRQIGEGTISRITDTEVIARLEYYVGKGNDDADWAWHLAEKRIAAFSHSFAPKKFVDADLDDEKVLREIMDGKREVRRYSDIETYELSHVIVGSNRDALLRSVSKGLYTEQQAQQVIELVEGQPEIVASVEDKAISAASAPDAIVEIKTEDDEPETDTEVEGVVDKAADPVPTVQALPVPVVDVSIRRIREEGAEAPETLEIRSGEALVFAGTPEALVLALHAAKGEPHVKIVVTHEHTVHAEMPAADRAALVTDLTSGLKEVTTSLQSAVSKLPTIPAHVAEYPHIKDLVKALAETIIPHAERAARTAAAMEVAKATGNVDAHLNGR